MNNGQYEQLNRKLDKILNLLQNGYIVDADTASTYTGSIQADRILDESYANNEPVGEVIKRYTKAKKSKVGKDLDKLDDIVDKSSESAVTRGESDFFNAMEESVGDDYNEWMLSRGGSDRDGI
tara:strand:- start:373 stop:741 length:369 start_codon:yes stop_codon:yes gene_type:complete